MKMMAMILMIFSQVCSRSNHELTDKAPRAIPITTTLRQRSICITMPLPHQDTDIAPTLSLTLTPSSDPITDFVDLAWDCPVVDDATRGRIEDAVEMQRGQKGDLVEIVHCIEKHLK